MANNKSALDSGFKKAKQLISNHLFSESIKLCDALVRDALNKREFQSFTGHTITSFACGIYQDGRLDYMVASGEDMAAPVHSKVRNGELVYLSNPYEGEPRTTRGKVDIVYNLSGMDTSFRILQDFSNQNEGISIIMTTGTEYSNYLESVYHLNVLSDTAKETNVRSLLYNSFKPLP